MGTNNAIWLKRLLDKATHKMCGSSEFTYYGHSVTLLVRYWGVNIDIDNNMRITIDPDIGKVNIYNVPKLYVTTIMDTLNTLYDDGWMYKGDRFKWLTIDYIEDSKVRTDRIEWFDENARTNMLRHYKKYITL